MNGASSGISRTSGRTFGQTVFVVFVFGRKSSVIMHIGESSIVYRQGWQGTPICFWSNGIANGIANGI